MKYAVGDYLKGETTVFMRVEAAIPGTPNLYALSNFKAHGILLWETEYELDQQKYVKQKPDFEKWKKAEAGDIVITPIGDDEDKTVRVIARVGNLVMLSTYTPSTKKRNNIEELAEQIDRITDGRLNKKELMGLAPKRISVMEAYSTADGEWKSIEELALWGWTLLKE